MHNRVYVTIPVSKLAGDASTKHIDKLVADIMKSYCPPTAKPGMAKMDYYTVGGRFGGFTGVVKGTDCYPNPSGQFDYTFTDEYDAYFYFGQQHGPYKFDNTEYVPVIGAKKKDIAFDSVNKLAVAIQLRVWEIMLKEDLRKQYLNGSIPEGCSVRADGVYANGELLLKKNETYAEAAKRHGVKFATFLTDPDAYIDLNGKWHSDDEVFADKAFMKKAEKSSGNLIAEAAEEFINRLIKYIENTLGDEDYIVMVDTHN